MVRHKLVLNAVPIALPDAKVAVGRLPSDKDVLDRLKSAQTADLFVQRHGDTIEAFALKAGTAAPGTEQDIDLASRPSLVAASPCPVPGSTGLAFP